MTEEQRRQSSSKVRHQFVNNSPYTALDGHASIPPMHTLFRRSFVSLLTVLFLLSHITDSNAAPVPPKERIVVLVSLDAFRWDYPQKFKAPNIAKLAAEGVHAERMIPMFPSMTFPNHHTIVTGLRPAHHGIIHNNIYDPNLKATFAFNKVELQGPEWWGGEPIWATAIKQGRRADVLFWPGTGTKMAGELPTEWKRYDGSVEPNGVVDIGLGWLGQPAEKRPSLVMLYLHHTDTVGHKNGPDSPEVATSVTQVDEAIGRLVNGIHTLKLDDIVNLVIVSDHGMVGISPDRTVNLGDFLDLKKVQVDFSGALAGLRPLDGTEEALFDVCKAHESHFKAYNSKNILERFHFRDNARIPPVILLADDSWYLSKRASGEPATREMNKATHGYDPELPSMGATFIASGPAFKKGVTLKPFENVHIYNFLCATLGLTPASNDGDDQLIKSVLAR